MLKWIQLCSVIIILCDINDTAIVAFQTLLKFPLFILHYETDKELKNVSTGYFLTCKGKVWQGFLLLLCKCSGQGKDIASFIR